MGRLSRELDLEWQSLATELSMDPSAAEEINLMMRQITLNDM
jgi:hypothetical protein